MIEKLVKKVRTQQIMFSGKLFDSIVYVFTEAQQWRQVIDLLTSMTLENCIRLEARDSHISSLNCTSWSLSFSSLPNSSTNSSSRF